MTGLTIVAPGALALVQDLGRPGLAHLGVGSAGAFDRAAHALANRLVGNDPSAAGLELLLGGAVLRPDTTLWIAYTGAWGPVTAGDSVVEPHTATRITAGTVVSFGSALHGLRYSVAVRGGVECAPVLGSRSWDSLAGLGPAPLAAGSQLPIGREPASAVPVADLVPVDPPADGTVTISLRPGPREDWFTNTAPRSLVDADWHVSARADRTGLRLDGPPLDRAVTAELPSEGMTPGAIQVSPDGAPTILGVDAPVTGGYPVIAVVTDDSLDALAQLRPGQALRFRRAPGHA